MTNSDQNPGQSPPAQVNYPPGSTEWRVAMATYAWRFFNPIHDAATAQLIDKPADANTFSAWTVLDFTKYLQKIGMQGGDLSSLTRLLTAMEQAGLLIAEGWDTSVSMLGFNRRYSSQGVTSAQTRGTLWLSEVLGADLIIKCYRAVTVMISSPDADGPGTGLVLDRNHVLTNRHVVEGLVGGGGRRQELEFGMTYVVFGRRPPSGPIRCDIVGHRTIDVAVIEADLPDDEGFNELPGMVFRDPDWADEMYLLGYPRVPWTTETAVTVQRGEVVNPATEAPPSDGYPARQKIFLYSAIARPGNSGGPIVAHDGRVIGLVVEHSASSARASAPGHEQSRTRSLSERVDHLDGEVEALRAQVADTPFYRGIPSGEIVRALAGLGFGDLATLESPSGTRGATTVRFRSADQPADTDATRAEGGERTDGEQ